MQTDPRIKAFLNRAAAIVAASQGLSSECLQQLELLARQLRLEPEEWQNSLDELRNQSAGDTPLNRYEQAFQQLAGSRLKRSAGRILSLGREAALLELASTRYQIGQVRAHQLLESVCQAYDIRRISRTDAEASFQQLARELIGDVRVAPPAVVSQLIDAGRGWGLGESQVRAIVAQFVRQNVQRRNRRLRQLLKTAVVMIVVAASLAGLARWVLQQAGERAVAVVEAKADPPETGVGPAPWWPGDGIAVCLGGLPDSVVWEKKLEAAGSLDGPGRGDSLLRLALEASTAPAATATALAGALRAAAGADPEREVVEDWLGRFIAMTEADGNGLPAGRPSLQAALGRAAFARQLLLPSGGNGGSPGEPDRRLPLPGPAGFVPGEVGLLRSWWSQLQYEPDLPASRIVAILGALRVASGQHFGPAQVHAWHRAVLLRTPVVGESLDGMLKEEIGVALASESLATVGPWTGWWRQLASGTVKTELGQMILSAVDVSPRPSGSGGVAERMESLHLELLAKRLPALFERQAIAESSVQDAAVQVEQRPDDPLTVAVTAQAVNDGLAAISLMEKGGELEAEAGTAAWRFTVPVDFSAGGESVPPPTAGARATAADLRALDGAMAELEAVHRTPERVSWRASALEDLLRIAPRLEDLPGPAARSLAGYYVSDLSVEEWLAAEKSLPGFRFWPAFLLALADGMTASQVPADQGISIAQLTAADRVRTSDADGWRAACRRALMDSAVLLLEQRTAANTAVSRARWNLLETSLRRIHAERADLAGPPVGLPGDATREGAGQALILAASSWNIQALPPGIFAERTGLLRDSELATVTVAAAVASQGLAHRLTLRPPDDPAIAAEWESLRQQICSPSRVPDSLAGQLLAVESGLLKLVTAVRRHRFRELTE